MKSFLTTLDLVMQDKVEPETVVEEDEIEETLTINEDGEIVDENWLTDKLKAAGTAVKGSFDRAKEKSQDDPTHWSNANMSKDDKSHMKTSRKMHKQLRKDIDNDNSEEDESTLMGGKYDESVEQIEKFVLECERLHEMKRLSGQVITEAPMTAEHYTAVADIIASIQNPNVRKAMMEKFTDDLEGKYANFQRERFVHHIKSKAQAQPVEEPQEEPQEEPADHPEGELVHINGEVLPDRIPHEEVEEWLRNTPGGGIAESA